LIIHPVQVAGSAELKRFVKGGKLRIITEVGALSVENDTFGRIILNNQLD